ncbi:HSP20-like chaperone [Coniochaeta ligniaria NRRL 30616]|uniref:HSP20-like chaperone n=1 Tax=Coniochaeta ligniaria NRRL 30616 TaxID=1408157 RepID=A0A1J7ICY5_9PEZI|nr:HSP20-like chaperone [Coniochaeta ligniaria NRRL 30616]
MSAYFTTHHFSPHWTTPRHSQDGEAQLPHPPPITTTVTAPSIAPPESSSASASPSPPHHHLTLDTLAHLLHDFHVQNTKTGDRDPVTHRSVARPHFDLLENKTSYAIYGELAGLGRKDVNVEVNDHLFTITIAGHLKRLTPPARPELGTAEDVGVVHRDAGENATKGSSSNGPEAGAAAAKTSDEATEKVPDQDVHWHVTERKVGEFRRAFQFPIETVDMAAVSASMSNGLLCVIVPKKIHEKKAGEARKVEIA